MAQVLPVKQPVHLTLVALDAQQQPLKHARFHLQILTPGKNPWWTTDFPIVEGTELLNMEAIVPEGKLDLQQVFPIRGRYQLRTEVTPLVANEFTPIQQTLTLAVPENPAKYRNFLILAVILLVVGWLGGVAIGGQQPIEPGEIAPQRVRLLLSGAILLAIAALLVVNISAEFTQSHSHEHQQHTIEPSVLQSQGLELKLSGDDHATVGQLAKLAAQIIDTQSGQPVTDTVFSIKATQLEEGELVFAYTGSPSAKGQLVWQQQFFDGAPHKIEVEVSPQPESTRQFKALRVAQEIEVEGVAPPLTTRFISLAYFTIMVGVGLALGLWQQQRKNRRTFTTKSAV